MPGLGAGSQVNGKLTVQFVEVDDLGQRRRATASLFDPARNATYAATSIMSFNVRCETSSRIGAA